MLQSAGIQAELPEVIPPLNRVPTLEDIRRLGADASPTRTWGAFQSEDEHAGEAAIPIIRFRDRLVGVSDSPQFKPLLGENHPSLGRVAAMANYTTGRENFELIWFMSDVTQVFDEQIRWFE